MTLRSIGIVCPYSLDVPGGVQEHVRDLAETLISLGHRVSVLAPAEDVSQLPEYVVSAGRAVSIPYNGSVARLAFGPVSAARVRRWIRAGGFDVVHVHEPAAPSLSLLVLAVARGPVVATFHTATDRSRVLSAAQGALQPFLERISGRIAVSSAARAVQVRHLDGGAVEIPNGVSVSRFADAEPLPGWPGPGGAIGFLGRFDESRKGFAVLSDAFTRLAPTHPELRLLVVGGGDQHAALRQVPRGVAERITFLGRVDDATKASALHSVDVFVAPNTGGESFGIVLTEAMAAGAPVVASDLDAFRAVLADGAAGVLTPVGDAAALARSLASLLADPDRRRHLAAEAGRMVAGFDWPVVAQRVLSVYDAVIDQSPGGVHES